MLRAEHCSRWARNTRSATIGGNDGCRHRRNMNYSLVSVAGSDAALITDGDALDTKGVPEGVGDSVESWV